MTHIQDVKIMCPHQLIEIPPGDWPKLLNLLAVNYPEHILGYSIVRNFIEWRAQKSRESEIRNLNFYSLDGQWEGDGTFLVIVSSFYSLPQVNL